MCDSILDIYTRVYIYIYLPVLLFSPSGWVLLQVREVNPGLPIGQMQKILSELWKGLSEEETARYAKVRLLASSLLNILVDCPLHQGIIYCGGIFCCRVFVAQEGEGIGYTSGKRRIVVSFVSLCRSRLTCVYSGLVYM